jgi:hypothetical protein
MSCLGRIVYEYEAQKKVLQFGLSVLRQQREVWTNCWVFSGISHKNKAKSKFLLENVLSF